LSALCFRWFSKWCQSALAPGCFDLSYIWPSTGFCLEGVSSLMLAVHLASVFSAFRRVAQTLCLELLTIAKQMSCLTLAKVSSRNCRAEGSL